MLLTDGPDTGRAPGVYLILALACAGVTGWALSRLLADGQTIHWVLTGGAAVGVGVAFRAYLLSTRRAHAARLAQFEERLHETEERFRQAQKMEAIGQLAGGIAHDFNNLVTVIGCSVGLLADATEANDPRQDDLSQIREAADRAAALTRQLLAFSRRQMLQPKSLDLNTVVRDMEKMIRRVIGTEISVHTTLDSRLGHVLADVGQMEQVMMNLALNARDAMPGGGALMFATSNRSIRMPEPHRHGVIEPGDYVTVTVRDTGHGMTTQVLDKLFEPFFTTKEQGKGTGLGLATVHGIVYQSGGHITVESSPDVGTTFTLWLPRMHGMDRVTTPPMGVKTGLVDVSEQRRSVLIVDDEDAIRDVASRVLQQAGFKVFTAKHGEEALKVLDRERSEGHAIALVLTDIVMPVMGGRELTEIVTKEYPESRVLCMSGYTRDELFRQYLIQETVQLVHKPFEVTELTAAVREALSGAQPAR